VTARVLLLMVIAACDPSAPSCSEVSGHVGKMFAPADAYSLDVEGAFLARCVNDAWSAEVRRCIVSTTSLTDPKNCKSHLTPSQAKLLDADLAQAERREVGRMLPKACLDLEVQVAAAMSCEAIPQAERDRIQKQLAISKAGWDKVIDKQLLAPTCGAAIAALKQATIDCKPVAPK
jgi:hypothetical protein